MPARPIVLHPHNTRLVWIARSRPKESHGTARRSGQFSFSDAVSPTAVPKRSHAVAHATYSYAIRTAAGSATSEGPTGAPKPRFWTMGANGSPALGGCQANVRDGPATKKSRLAWNGVALPPGGLGHWAPGIQPPKETSLPSNVPVKPRTRMSLPTRGPVGARLFPAGIR